MSSPESLQALRKTKEALIEIQTQLRPFLRDLASAESATKNETTSRANPVMESMAIALTMGTLRYMGARLRGLDQGRDPEDPLRKELNQMRKTMVALQKKLAKEENEKKPNKRKAATENEPAIAEKREKESKESSLKSPSNLASKRRKTS